MIARIIYVIVLIAYALLTGIIGQAINGFGPGWFDILCMLIGIGIFWKLGLWGWGIGLRLARVKGNDKKYSVVYVVLVGYLLLMAIISFVFSICNGFRWVSVILDYFERL